MVKLGVRSLILVVTGAGETRRREVAGREGQRFPLALRGHRGLVGPARATQKTPFTFYRPNLERLGAIIF